MNSIEPMPYITRYSGALLSFYVVKRHENWTFSFLKWCTLFEFTFATYIDKVVKIAHYCGDLTLEEILNLNDDIMEYWNYVQCRKPNSFSVHIGINIARILV